MKMRKNKGKIHPSPSQSSSSMPPSSISNPNQNALSVLTVLPAAILALISVLSIEDKEVFAYMVTTSMKSSSAAAVNPCSCSIAAVQEKNKKKNSNSSGKKLLLVSGSIVHKPPVFDCECFDCYTSYWFRWDSSPNRELIHKAIEEYEEHLFSQEQVKKSSSNKGKKREKIGRLVKEKPVEKRELVSSEESFVVGVPENEVFVVGTPENDVAAEEVVDAAAAVVEEGRDVAVSENKGFVRKVLPDVVGILNSRLWGLWSPNV